MEQNCGNCKDMMKLFTESSICVDCIKPSDEPQEYPHWQPSYPTLLNQYLTVFEDHRKLLLIAQQVVNHADSIELVESLRELTEMVPRTPGKCNSFF